MLGFVLNPKAVVYLRNQYQPENDCIFWRTANSPNVIGKLKTEIASVFNYLIKT